MASKAEGGQSRETRSKTKENIAADMGETAVAGNPEVAERQEKLTEDVDAILDEIDDVLETNAEDFVRNYVQKGGE